MILVSLILFSCMIHSFSQVYRVSYGIDDIGYS